MRPTGKSVDKGAEHLDESHVVVRRQPTEHSVDATVHAHLVREHPDVVCHVAVRQHYGFGGRGRAGGELDVMNIARICRGNPAAAILVAPLRVRRR